MPGGEPAKLPSLVQLMVDVHNLAEHPSLEVAELLEKQLHLLLLNLNNRSLQNLRVFLDRDQPENICMAAQKELEKTLEMANDAARQLSALHSTMKALVRGEGPLTGGKEAPAEDDPKRTLVQ